MFNIIENKKPDLKIVKMICDKCLNPKLNDIEIYKYLNSNTSTLFLGRPASGKSSLMSSILFSKPPNGFSSTFDHIYLFMPSASRHSLGKFNKFDEELDDDELYDDLTIENLTYVYDKIKNTDPSENSLIILDDQTAYLKNNDVAKLLNDINYNRRHYHTSIWYLCQNYKSIPKTVRSIFKNLFIFKCSIDELTNIFKELVEGFKYDIGDLMKFVYDKPHNFLFINTENQKLFKNWDEIIL